MTSINNTNSALTGRATAGSHLTKPGFDRGDISACDVIDAPEWVPTGSHAFYEITGANWVYQVVFAEHFRAGVVFA